MVKVSATIFIFYVTSTWSAMDNHPASWLDRLVFHYKKLFLAEVSKMPAIPFHATIEKAPSGYVDSTAWDFDSVMRLITLIQTTDNMPVRRVIHEALKPTRRLFISPGRNKFKLFPSLAKDHVDNFYYDGVASAEYWASDEVNVFNASDTSAIILVTNPVEARLPSARISVDLLKDIMMTRALAAREMPTTTTTLRSTIQKTKHGADSTTLDPNAPTTAAAPAADNTTSAADATTSAADATTSAADATTSAADATTSAAGSTNSTNNGTETGGKDDKSGGKDDQSGGKDDKSGGKDESNTNGTNSKTNNTKTDTDTNGANPKTTDTKTDPDAKVSP